MARKLFDTGIFSMLAAGGGFGVGATLAFYTAGTATPIITYNAPSAGSANANPVVADAYGRFDEIWIETGQSVKYVATIGAVSISVDNFPIAADAPTVAAGLLTFLAGSAALPIANGGTGSTTAADAATALAVLKLAGGTVSGDIIRSGKGIHPYYNSASMTGGKLYAQALGTDPTANAGDIVFEW